MGGHGRRDRPYLSGAYTMTGMPLTGLALAGLMLTAAAPVSQGMDIVEHGTGSEASACMSCHGAKLEGNPALKAPALAGLPAATVLARLAHYAGPDGHNAAMRAVATALNQPERTAVANYIASLPKAAARPQ
jgi:cytochrome c553